MMYRINWDVSDGVFAVPDYVADTLLKNMSPAAAKVVLLLFSCKRSLQMDFGEIAAAAGKGVTREDVEDAFSDLLQTGLLFKDGEAPAALNQTAEITSSGASVPEKAKERRMFTPAEISGRIKASNDIAALFEGAETILGRILNHTEHRTLLWLYDYYGFKPDILLMLAEYCKSIDKTNIGYMEKIAVSWHEKGIDTHSKAEGEIRRLQQYYSYSGRMKSLLGLDRAMTAKERGFVNNWSDMQVSYELAELAFEKTVAAAGKLSFAYMDKIISEWYKNGVKTASDAESLDTVYRKRGGDSKSNLSDRGNNKFQKVKEKKHSFDVKEILEFSRKNIFEE